MFVLAIEMGGTHMKILAAGQQARQDFESHPKRTAKLLVAGAKKPVVDWN